MKKIILILFLLLCRFGYPQTDLSFPTINFKQLNISDGLPGANVKSINQDSTGYLWIGTFNGLSGFDGYDFTAPTMRFSEEEVNLKRVLKIVSDPASGQLFLNGAEQIVQFDPFSGDASVIYQTLKDETIIDLLVSSINQLWVLTSKKIFRIPLSNHLISSDIEIIAQYEDVSRGSIIEHKNKVWFGFDRLASYDLTTGEFTILPLKQFTVPSGHEEYSENYSYGQVFDIVATDTNTLWMATTAGLIEFNVNKRSFNQRLSNTEFLQHSDNLVNCLHVDKKGYLWCGTQKSGIFVYQTKTATLVHHIPLSHSMNDFFYSDKFEDGVIWISTENGILYADMNPSYIKDYPGLDALNIRSVMQTENQEIWIGTVNNGVYKKDNSHKKFALIETLSDIFGTVGAFAQHQNNIWISSWNGSIIRYNRIDQTQNAWSVNQPQYNLKGWVFNDLHISPDDQLWIASLTGELQKYDRETNSFIQYDLQAYQAEKRTRIFTIYQPTNSETDTIWLGTSTGLIQFSYTSGSVLNAYREAGNPKDIFALYKTNNRLWIGTLKDGLYRFDLITKTFQRYTTADGLPDNTIYAIYEDDEGLLWLITRTGIVRISDLPLKRENIRYIKSISGKENAEFNWNAQFQNIHTKEIFAGGTQGLISFHPEELTFNPFPPKPYITEISVNGNCLQHGTIQPEIKLKNSVQIKFSSAHYANPRHNSFRYKMEQTDTNWVYSSSQDRTVTFTNLLPGKYIFTISAGNPNGVWSTNNEKYVINITPKWWSFKWFILLFLFVLCLGVIWGIIHVKTKNTLQQKPDKTVRTDETFLKQAEMIIHKNMVNPEFDNELFIQEMGLSRSNIYQKIKLHTGKSLSEFIREQRLVYAAELLTAGNLTVSEAAYKSGFKDPANFSRYFKKQFGVSPSEYGKNQ